MNNKRDKTPVHNIYLLRHGDSRQDYGCMNVIDFDSHGMRLLKMNLAGPGNSPPSLQWRRLRRQINTSPMKSDCLFS